MAAIVQALSRPPTDEAAITTSRPAPPPQPPTTGAATDDPPPSLIVRPEAPYPLLQPYDWTYDEAPPRRLDGGEDEALIAEAQFSVLGLFRMETRAVTGGFAVVVRHADLVTDARLGALADAVASEADRYGVRARVRFTYDPTLRPTT